MALKNPNVKINLKLEDKTNVKTSLNSVNDAIVRVKQKIKSGSEEGFEELSSLTADYQKQKLQSNGNVSSGSLYNSIIADINGRTAIIGSTLDGFAPTVVENGRGAIVPVRAKALHYFIDGKEIFSQYSKPYKGNPYVAPSYTYAKSIAKETVWNAINK